MAQAAKTSAAKAYQYHARTWGGGSAAATPLIVCAVSPVDECEEGERNVTVKRRPASAVPAFPVVPPQDNRRIPLRTTSTGHRAD